MPTIGDQLITTVKVNKCWYLLLQGRDQLPHILLSLRRTRWQREGWSILLDRESELQVRI